MKKVIAIALLAVCALGLSACEDPTTETQIGDSNFSEVQVPLKDGRVVTCLVRYGSHGASIDCDWVGAR